MNHLTEFTSRDLIWTKNVKRDSGNDWAYMEYNLGDVFFLNWPRGRADMGKTDAGKVKINELILLFQSVNKSTGYPKGTYLTHIVTPIDQVVYVDEHGLHPFKRLVSVVAKCEEPIPKPHFLNFQEPNRGWACSLNTIKPLRSKELTLSEKQEIFWELFVHKDVEAKEFNLPPDQILLNPNFESLEGEEKFRYGRHKYYERDPKLIADKKRMAADEGKLFCTVCNFDFKKKYGIHGMGFIECHHIHPIASSGKRLNGVEHLALVCSNCHSMLHKKNLAGGYFSVSELKEIIEKERKPNAS